jgi:hypothetical protein
MTLERTREREFDSLEGIVFFFERLSAVLRGFVPRKNW